jgi:hypothetical protein
VQHVQEVSDIWGREDSAGAKRNEAKRNEAK